MSTQMHVITVAPIVRANARSISYFSPVPYQVGSVLTVPVRKHAQQHALVLESKPAASLKSELRSADFKLRKLPEQNPTFPIHPPFIQTILKMSNQFALSPGALLAAALPHVAFDAAAESSYEARESGRFEYTYFQELPEARYEFFKNHVRSLFAKGKSTIILAPTGEKVEYLARELSRGIEKHTFFLHGKLSAKKQSGAWRAACDNTHPVLIVATPHYLALPRRDLGSIIIEEEGSQLYETQARPYLNFRIVAREYAREASLACITADTLVRAETYMHAAPHEGTRFIYPSSATSRIIDMTKYNEEKKEFEIISPQTQAALEQAETKKVILFVTRRGSYPLTQCNDCGTIVKCERCNYPLVLYVEKAKNVYRCHMCNRTYDTHIRCHRCQGWRLSLYGIAADRVRQHIKEQFPTISLFSLDGSAQEKRETVEDFENARGGVLITRASGLPFIHAPVDTVSVISIDPLFAIPDIGVSERIARLLLLLRAKAQKKFLIQVRNAEEEVLSYVAGGDTKALLEAELEDRAQFDLPPHAVFIKLTWSGRYAERTKESVREKLRAYSPDLYFSFYRTKRGGRIYNALISLAPDQWPDTELQRILSRLPRSVGINVHPESIL